MSAAGRRDRFRAWRWGRWAERLCAWRLRAAGYRIVARGFRSPFGEIDLIARRGRVIAFIEVKARPTADAALVALSLRQRRRIERAAAAFLAARPGLAGFSPRFDLMLAVPWRLPVHRPNAWTETD